ncbi:MAG: D-alanyl-D-alanine carboxypeptidase/D-alanyl-D-alanine-endopeptidase [Pseudomonadota bacterium]|nr:D-alanyl-D-alanine carboxypeptidase/D-alanyl-D-alanine-endopeptidase [Pseudomonadota bacterium]
MRLRSLSLTFALATLALASAAAAPRHPPAAGAPNALPAAVSHAIAASGLPAKSFGLYAQEVVGDRTVFSLNAEQPYTMASTTKIVTSLAALDLLGPYYRWHTSAYVLGTLADGKLVGDLLIVGGGNAQLTSVDLARWFKRMHDQGLREIDGDIVLDRDAFRLSRADHAGTPAQSPYEPRHVWPDAMTLDEGVVEVLLQPGRGPRPTALLRPALSEVRIDNRLSTGGCDAQPSWQAGRNGWATVALTGSWGPACGSRAISLVPPPESGIAARALPALWARAGGVLRGRVVSSDSAPPPEADIGAPFSFDRSKPLTELVRDINKASDNVGARHLMLSLSPGFPNRPATLAGARQAVDQWLLAQGLAEGDIEVENGSGLSHSERAKPRALVQLLRRAWRAEQAQAFFDSLPIAGVDGTMKGRLVGSRAAGQAYLKTGTLNDTRALAGYVHGLSGKMYAVALMVNGSDPAAGRPALDAMVAWLAKNG